MRPPPYAGPRPLRSFSSLLTSAPVQPRNTVHEDLRLRILLPRLRYEVPERLEVVFEHGVVFLVVRVPLNLRDARSFVVDVFAGLVGACYVEYVRYV